MPSHRHLATAALIAMTPTLALGWTPEPPPGYGPQGYGFGGFPPPYAYPEMGPGAGYPWGPRWGGPVPERPPVPGATDAPPPGAPGDQAGEQGPVGPGYAAPYGYGYSYSNGPRGERAQVQLRVTREMTDDAYLVHVLVSDGKTEEVQVTPRGRSLDISRSANTRTEQEDTFDDGRGYQRSFSFSTGSVRQYVALPADADLGAMTRETKDGTITLRIPRRAQSNWGPGYGTGGAPADPSNPRP